MSGPDLQHEHDAKAPDLDDVLDVPGAAALLRCGRDAIYTACGRKQIPHRRVGNRIRFSRRALLRWLECNESPAP